MGVSLSTLNSLFLAELAALDAHAARREAEGGLRVGAEDPDVRRLIEAMAFFSARTRAAARGGLDAAVRRIAGGTLDDLLVPSPAAMMVQVVPDAALKQPALLPAGCQLRVVSPEGTVGIFTTKRSLSILPVVVAGAALADVRRRLSVRIDLRALAPRGGPAALSLYVRRLSDYRASLALLDALQRHAVRAFAVADGDGAELSCGLRFGAPRALRPEDEEGGPSPLAEIRSFFHFPEQDLFVHVDVPAARRPWTALSIHIEVDEAFPTDLSVSNDTFQLSVVPAENAWSDLAEPILCDGTKDTYPIRSARAILTAVELQGVRGVFQTADRGLAPILPAALAQDGDAYEVEEAEDGGAPSLRLRVAGAFEKPCKIQVDARWSQPSLWYSPVGRLSIALQTRHLPGVTLRALGTIRRPAESPLASDPVRCLDVLSLRMRPILSRRDLTGVLEVLGASGESVYSGMPALVDTLEAFEAADARPAGGIKRVYRLGVRRRTPEDAPLVRRLAAQIAALLDAWTEDAVDIEIETRPDAPRRPLPEGRGGA